MAENREIHQFGFNVRFGNPPVDFPLCLKRNIDASC